MFLSLCIKQNSILFIHNCKNFFGHGYPHLRNFKLPDLSLLLPWIEILIGADLASTMVLQDGTVRRSSIDNPAGFVTSWGPVIVGPTNRDARMNKFSSAFVSFDNERLNRQMNEVFSEGPRGAPPSHSLPALAGMLPCNFHHGPPTVQDDGQPFCEAIRPSRQDLPESSKHSIDDLRAFKIMQETVSHVGDKYQVGALWNKPRDQITEEMKKIPSMATAHRLLRLGQKLGNDPDNRLTRDMLRRLTIIHPPNRFQRTSNVFTSLYFPLKTKESRKNDESPMIARPRRPRNV